jgi:hypothetical protein
LKELKRADNMVPLIRNPFTAITRRDRACTEMPQTLRATRSRGEIHVESDEGKVTTVLPSARFKLDSDSDDSEDDELENKINENLEAIGTMAWKLKNLTVLQRVELEHQHRRVLEIENKASDVHEGVESNQAVLQRRYH